MQNLADRLRMGVRGDKKVCLYVQSYHAESYHLIVGK